MTSTKIQPSMTMEEILRIFPSAQRALFQRYHVGGCSACAFQPTDTLEEVCRDHNLLDVQEVLLHLERSDELDRRMQVEPRTVKSWLDAGEALRFIDVRTPQEIEAAPIAEAEPLDFTDQGKYMGLPKDTKFVFASGTGARSLDVAAYFVGHGFEQVYSLKGGAEAWGRDIGPEIPAR
ncbi:MAG TPA: rhodanese-like domain-containing protein [Planctomycetes bacterium]|nr:rhodanese-like domain-containing protein [Planctomycetota bacterium]